jgi:hypothetical protein
VAQSRITVARDNERLVFAIVRYLGDCASIPAYQEFIKQNLGMVFSVLIQPNIAITQDDMDEYFEDP